MKNIIKQFITLNKVSFLLLTLPYIGFNWVSLHQSPFFSYTNLFGLVGVLLAIEVIIKTIITKSYKYEKQISNLLIICCIVFLYGYYLVLIILKFTNNLSSTPIRGRIIILIIILILVFSQFLLRKTNYYKSLNIFLLIFSTINFTTNYQSLAKSKEDIDNIKKSYQQIHLKEKSNKPVILLISDEYNSPDGLYKVFKDSSLYAFSTYLQKNKWIVRNTAYSHETSTIHSLSSLFNFNLSKSNSYSKSNIYDIGANKLIKASIYDSLSFKKVDLINFGIFDIGKSKPISNLYQYPKNFLDHTLINTSYYYAKNNTNGFKITGFKKSFYILDEHNQFIFKKAADSLNSFNSKRKFIYAHLYMPHAPMHFQNEFQTPPRNDLDGYVSYWKFTNLKLKELLITLIKENKYRIILTGDHGYRGDKRINAKHTFMAFYGFDNQDLSTVKSVQDLGNLINACYL